jgi:large subunit ribosomal protein L37Ae
MGGTAKVKTAGRFGSRYGVGIRKRVIKIEGAQKKKHKCPCCGFARVKRLAAGIYHCRKCRARFAGGAYVPETMSGGIVKKMVAQKAFLPYAKELLEMKGEAEAAQRGTTERPEEEKSATSKAEAEPHEKAGEKQKPQKLPAGKKQGSAKEEKAKPAGKKEKKKAQEKKKEGK